MFTPAEDAPGGPRVAILSHGLWMALFGGDPGALGKPVRLDGQSYAVVGVLPPDLRLPTPARLWVPIAGDPARAGSYRYSGLARLAAGATPESAQRDLDRILDPLREAHPLKRAISPVVTSFREQLVGAAGSTTWSLMLAVALVLIVACVNVAALQLARGASRAREMGIRVALGARQGRLVGQLLTESLLVAVAGGGLGIALGTYGLRALGALAAGELPFWVSFAPRPQALLVCLTAGVATTLLFGLFPAALTARVTATQVLRSGAGGLSAQGARRGALSGLVVAEVALVQALLIATGLVLLSQRELLGVDPGYRPGDALTFGLALSETDYADEDARLALYRDLRRELEALPGVASVAASTNLPLQTSDRWFFEAEGAGDPGASPLREATLIRQSTDGFLAAMGIPLLSGRELAARPTLPGELREVVVDERFAELHWPGGDPIGRRIRAGEDSPWLTVVGVCGNVRHSGLEEPAQPGVYLPLSNHPPARIAFVLRTSVTPASLIPEVRNALHRLDAGLPLYGISTLEEQLDRSLTLRHLTSLLFGSFAAVALALAAAGVFGVVSYLVDRRIPELGLRSALGATAWDLLALVLGQGTRLAFLGSLLGLLAALAFGKLLEGLLFGVDARDPRAFAGSALFLLAITVGAVLLPAARAARVLPMQALRED
jgi:predicted permease